VQPVGKVLQRPVLGADVLHSFHRGHARECGVDALHLVGAAGSPRRPDEYDVHVLQHAEQLTGTRLDVGGRGPEVVQAAFDHHDRRIIGQGTPGTCGVLDTRAATRGPGEARATEPVDVHLAGQVRRPGVSHVTEADPDGVRVADHIDPHTRTVDYPGPGVRAGMGPDARVTGGRRSVAREDEHAQQEKEQPPGEHDSRMRALGTKI